MSGEEGLQDKILFTPGPLSTSMSVKRAMLHDYGSRDSKFMHTVLSIHEKLLRIAGCDPETFAVILMQGSGTFGVEAVLSSVFPPSIFFSPTADPLQPKLLILINGAYGERMASMAKTHRIPYLPVSFKEDTVVDPSRIAPILIEHPSITHIAIVHCETTSGIMNPVTEVGQAIADVRASHPERSLVYIVDAMSSFGAVPIDLNASQIDYLVSSSNKCIQGCPGFSLILARLAHLAQIEGYSRTLSLDIYAQWKTFVATRQFRFTPPTHALLAFHQALQELEDEGGVEARAARYRENNRIIIEGLSSLGFVAYLKPEVQGHIISTFSYLSHEGFDFPIFYEKLNNRNCVIYPGKLTQADCFRIGNIGNLFPDDMRWFLTCVSEVLREMNVIA